MTRPGAGDPMDGRLGRRFAGHDERSRAHAVRPLLGAVVRKPTRWPLPEAGRWPLDQGSEGACTGYGMAHELAAGPVMVPGVDDGYARERYRRNREEDAAMGHRFPEGATVLGTMRAARRDGLITGYRWAFGVDDVVDTLCSTGPVCLGIDWYSGMYATDAGGRLRVSGVLVGGHFVVLVGYTVHPWHGPCVLVLNSWGRAWGVADDGLGAPGGVGYLTLPDLATLLAADGEAVVPADFFTEPAPAPEPERPTPPAPPAEPPFFAMRTSRVFHDRHWLVPRHRTFATYSDAVVAGLRPCRVCRPQDRRPGTGGGPSLLRRWLG